ncbi:MAG: PilZ domain-containing protein [Planctomycetota bacterium]|nr:PilZ domain-containing protein [Planctomycetota bacterium]
MNSLYQSFPLLTMPEELDRAIAVGLAVVAAAIFYRFFENIFDVLGAGGRVRRFFIAEWGDFEARLDQLKIRPNLRQLLQAWALENHPHHPTEVLENRLFFETWVSQLVQRPGFDTHSHRESWLNQMRALRVGLPLLPGVEDQVISSRELRVGALLHLTQTHPDLENSNSPDSIAMKVEQINDLVISGRLSDKDLTLNKGEYWCRFSHDGDKYRFQTTLNIDRDGLISLDHGRFIIREKRGDQRIRYEGELTIHWQDGEESREMQVSTLDLSRSGIALASESLIPLKTVLTLTLPLPGSTALQSVQAEILDVTPYSQGLVRLHCHFMSLEQNEIKRLEDFVRKVRKSKAPEGDL